MSYAQAPERIHYQGRLKEGGVPVNGSVVMVFRIYDAEANGQLQYAETQTVAVGNGLYAVEVGAMNTATGELISALAGGEAWLELEANGSVLSPRERIGSVAYALVSDGVRAGGVTREMLSPALSNALENTHWSEDNGDVFRLNGNVGIGTETPMETLELNGTRGNGVTSQDLRNVLWWRLPCL